MGTGGCDAAWGWEGALHPPRPRHGPVLQTSYLMLGFGTLQLYAVLVTFTYCLWLLPPAENQRAELQANPFQSPESFSLCFPGVTLLYYPGSHFSACVMSLLMYLFISTKQ